MKNHYPVTWWLMVVLTSLLAGALPLKQCLLAGTLPLYQTFLISVGYVLATAGTLVNLSESKRRKLLARMRSGKGEHIQVCQKITEGQNLYLGTLSDAELSRMEMEVFQSGDLWLHWITAGAVYVLASCLNALRWLPKGVLCSVILLLIFSPDTLTTIIHGMIAASTEEMVRGGRLVLITVTPVWLIISLMVTYRYGSPLRMWDETPAKKALNNKLQRHFNTATSAGFVLVPADAPKSDDPDVTAIHRGVTSSRTTDNQQH